MGVAADIIMNLVVVVGGEVRKCTYGNIIIHLTFPNVTPAHPQTNL